MQHVKSIYAFLASSPWMLLMGQDPFQHPHQPPQTTCKVHTRYGSRKDDNHRFDFSKMIHIYTHVACVIGIKLKHDKFALLWGEAEKKFAYCYPKVT